MSLLADVQLQYTQHTSLNWHAKIMFKAGDRVKKNAVLTVTLCRYNA